MSTTFLISQSYRHFNVDIRLKISYHKTMSAYLQGKQLIQQYANQGVEPAIETIECYNEIKEQSGSFIAARFIRDVYIDFCEGNK